MHTLLTPLACVCVCTAPLCHWVDDVGPLAAISRGMKPPLAQTRPMGARHSCSSLDVTQHLTATPDRPPASVSDMLSVAAFAALPPVGAESHSLPLPAVRCSLVLFVFLSVLEAGGGGEFD